MLAVNSFKYTAILFYIYKATVSTSVAMLCDVIFLEIFLTSLNSVPRHFLQRNLPVTSCLESTIKILCTGTLGLWRGFPVQTGRRGLLTFNISLMYLCTYILQTHSPKQRPLRNLNRNVGGHINFRIKKLNIQ